jgi:hypothetical protein
MRPTLLVLLGLVLAAVAVITIQQLPDIQRYLKMRSM